MTTMQRTLFDYEALDTETRIVIQQRTSEIKSLMKRAASDIIDIGQKLIEVKARLGHGPFEKWVETEFDWSYPTAARFMQVAKCFDQNYQIDNFAPSALYLLAAPSTPESARQEAVERAAAGERITHQAARGIVSTHKDPAIPFATSPSTITGTAIQGNVAIELLAADGDMDEPPIAYQAQAAAPYAAPVPSLATHQPPLPSQRHERDEQAEPPAPATHQPATSSQRHELPAAPASPAVHQLLTSSESNEWYTPAEYVDAARAVMGGIDLDPASNALANQTVQATRFYSLADDGFAQPWGDEQRPLRVWLNPPYGKDGGESNAARWTRRLLTAYQAGQVAEAVLLVNASTGDGWFAPLKQFPICFPDARIRFYTADGEASQPTHSNALVYLGPNIAQFVAVFSRFGAVMARLTADDQHVFVEGLER